MTRAQAMEGTGSEEVTSRLSKEQSNHDIDAIKQNRGQLSFRSRKMLNLFHKGGGGPGQVEKKVPGSARDVKLEVVSNPPELSAEGTKEAPKIKTPELKKTVRTVVTRNSSSFRLAPASLKERENGKPPKAISGNQQQVVIDEATETPTKKKQLLPARLKLLETFYEGLEAAISLLAIRRQMCTFKSVCKTVEQMSKRRFLRTHLAQLKSLFPEVIEIDYVRVPDQDSRRDIWDLRINLKHYPALPGGSPLKGAASPSRDKNAQTLRRKREFHSRLLKFARSHNEDVEVPQGPLPQRPLGGQSLSSPNGSAASPGNDFVSGISAGGMKQGLEPESGVASHVNEEDHNDVSEIPDAPEEAKFPQANCSEDVYEFCIVKPGSVSILDIDVTSHFPPSFRPHFQERGTELSLTEKTNSAFFLDVGLISHFPPSFKPRFQERHRELSSSQSGCSSGTVPSEVHLQTSAIASRTIKHFPSFERHFPEPAEEDILEDHSQPSPPAEDHVSLQSLVTQPERSSLKSISAESNSGSSAHREKTVVHAGDSLAAGEEGDAQVQEAPTIFSALRSPIRGTSRDGIPASTPASTPAKAVFSLSPAIVSPVSTREAEISQEHPLSTHSVRCFTPAPSTSGAADSLPNTPYTSEILSTQYSPAATHTPASLSPSLHYQYVQGSSIPNNLKSPERHVKEAVPVKGQGTMRALKFGSPIRPPRPPQRQAEVFAPETPQVNTPVESTPRDESKYALSQSSSHTPQATTPEASFAKSSYFSPVRPPRSRALRFSTPEKIREDNEASAAKLGGASSSSEQLFKSPQATIGAMKPPRFMSPPKAQISSAPATPVPSTPVRSILYSPPKRTKFNRGSLFSYDEQEEDVVQVRHTPVSHGENAKASIDVTCGAPDLLLSSDTQTLEETLTTPAKDSPSKTRKALSYVSPADLAIISSLPAELVHSVREKERKIKDENTKELILEKKRQQMMAGLPKMFNQLRLIFQSLKRSVLPRNELIKNVLSTNPDITDRGEVEERLKLLIDLAPDWITKHPSANGDYIYRINKSANVTRVQKKILEAC